MRHDAAEKERWAVLSFRFRRAETRETRHLPSIGRDQGKNRSIRDVEFVSRVMHKARKRTCHRPRLAKSDSEPVGRYLLEIRSWAPDTPRL